MIGVKWKCSDLLMKWPTELFGGLIGKRILFNQGMNVRRFVQILFTVDGSISMILFYISFVDY